jgi:hypothetical protein
MACRPPFCAKIFFNPSQCIFELYKLPSRRYPVSVIRTKVIEIGLTSIEAVRATANMTESSQAANPLSNVQLIAFSAAEACRSDLGDSLWPRNESMCLEAIAVIADSAATLSYER